MSANAFVTSLLEGDEEEEDEDEDEDLFDNAEIEEHDGLSGTGIDMNTGDIAAGVNSEMKSTDVISSPAGDEEVGIKQDSTLVAEDVAAVTDDRQLAPHPIAVPLSADTSFFSLAAVDQHLGGSDDIEDLSKIAASPSIPSSPPPSYSPPPSCTSMRSEMSYSPLAFSPQYSMVESNKARGAFGGSSTIAEAFNDDETEDDESVRKDEPNFISSEKSEDNRIGSNFATACHEEVVEIVQERACQLAADVTSVAVADGMSLVPKPTSIPLSVDTSLLPSETGLSKGTAECSEVSDGLDKLMFKLSNSPIMGAVSPSMSFSPSFMYSTTQPGNSFSPLAFSPQSSMAESNKAWAAFGGSSTLSLTLDEEDESKIVKDDDALRSATKVLNTVHVEDDGTELDAEVIQSATPDDSAELFSELAAEPVILDAVTDDSAEADDRHEDEGVNESETESKLESDPLLIEGTEGDSESETDGPLAEQTSAIATETEISILPAKEAPPASPESSDIIDIIDIIDTPDIIDIIDIVDTALITHTPIDETVLTIAALTTDAPISVSIEIEDDAPDDFVSTLTFGRKSPFGYTRPAMSPLTAEAAAVYLRKSRSFHLGGGAAGIAADELKSIGYEQHVGMWRGWPFDSWTCCNTASKVCPGNSEGVSTSKSRDSRSPWKGPNCSHSRTFLRTSRSYEAGSQSFGLGTTSYSSGVTTSPSSSCGNVGTMGAMRSMRSMRSVTASPRYTSDRGHGTSTYNTQSDFESSNTFTSGRTHRGTRTRSSSTHARHETHNTHNTHNNHNPHNTHNTHNSTYGTYGTQSDLQNNNSSSARLIGGKVATTYRTRSASSTNAGYDIRHSTSTKSDINSNSTARLIGGKITYQTNRSMSSTRVRRRFSDTDGSGGNTQSTREYRNSGSNQQKNSSIHTATGTDTASHINIDTTRYALYPVTTGSMSSRSKRSKSVSDAKTAQSPPKLLNDSGMKSVQSDLRNKDDYRPRVSNRTGAINSNSAFYSTLMKQVFVMAGEGLTIPAKKTSQRTPQRVSNPSNPSNASHCSHSHSKTLQVAGNELRGNVSQGNPHGNSHGNSQGIEKGGKGVTQDYKSKTAPQPLNSFYSDGSKSSPWKPAGSTRVKNVPSPHRYSQ